MRNRNIRKQSTMIREYLHPHSIPDDKVMFLIKGCRNNMEVLNAHLKNLKEAMDLPHCRDMSAEEKIEFAFRIDKEVSLAKLKYNVIMTPTDYQDIIDELRVKLKEHLRKSFYPFK